LRLGNPTPALSLVDVVDNELTNAKLLCQVNAAFAVISAAAYLSHLVFV
jgi:hypothetical protein